MKPRIAITMGDPAGVGPEIIIRCLDDAVVRSMAELVVIGSWALMEEERDQRVPAVDLQRLESMAGWNGESVGVLDIMLHEGVPVVPGNPDRRGSRMAGIAVEEAAGLALGGAVDAVVTAPLMKRAFAEIGSPHHGHTEYFAWRAGVEKFAMMFVMDDQRVVLGTTHIPLGEVPAALSKGRIVDCVRLLDTTLQQKFGIGRPRLGVAGLNPHAGEGGLLGSEENDFIIPAVKECRGSGIQVTGPHPADTMFWRMSTHEFDGVVALYHDQALIPVKLLGPERAVNVTLGLPFVRTSVSHGTGFDIAGRSLARAASLIEAVKLAARLAKP
ncbi:MAG: 4-hydroxythreonine-4-phosphate dehydrogenase PdxA [Candidatus Eisenbacteria sp.]|nr:4-hydroxythreonine-4-phosphate dehydrogenase PdxA [Candidatus Eisenbacteria bacterium]